MPPAPFQYTPPSGGPSAVIHEDDIEYGFLCRLRDLKQDYRPDNLNRATLDRIVEYKNDPGNGYTKTLLCFLQLFIVSNRQPHQTSRHECLQGGCHPLGSRALRHPLIEQTNTRTMTARATKPSFVEKLATATVRSQSACLIATPAGIYAARSSEVASIVSSFC